MTPPRPGATATASLPAKPPQHRTVAIGLCLLAGLLGGCATLPPPTEPAATPVSVAPPLTAATAAAPLPTEPPVATPAAPAPAVSVAPVPILAPPAPPAGSSPLATEPATPVSLDELVQSIVGQPHGDLWARVRQGFAIPDLDDPLVDRRERYYASQPEYLRRMTERAGRYLFYIVEEVERRGLPAELALLPFIESAFNPQALSSAKASGIWQFMPATGRHFDLTQNLFRDDRRDVMASTRAALDYLQKLHGMFGDWHLALAAYNWGEGNVSRAIARNRAAGQPTDYRSLRMPRETRDYVPKLQSIENIVARPDAFGVTLEPMANLPYFTSVPVPRDIDVDLAARLAGLRLDDFKALNPQMNKPVILAAGTPTVLLPHDNAEQFVIALAQHEGPMASWTAWVAPATMSPAAAAQRVGMTEAALRELNRIPPSMLVRAGSALLVPRAPSRQTDVSEHVAENGMLALSPDPAARRRLVLKAGPNDTVATVARRYRVSADQVADWNRTTPGARFAPGDRIIVFAAPGPARASARPKAARPKASRPAARPQASRAARPPAARPAARPAERRGPVERR
jgi:membrane-bound lytic murein transglycosylase D